MKSQQKKSWFYLSITIVVVFIISWLVFAIIGLVPDSLTPNVFRKIQRDIHIVDNLLRDESYTRPDYIIIKKIGVSSPIGHPSSKTVSVLDKFLKQGAVHYPGSGSIESGNIFLFGHSSSWQPVQNEAYETFNGLENLEPGDMIELKVGEQSWFYKVTNVKLVNENTALVEFDSSKRTLTISTCNSFGTKEQRWVIEAELFGTGS